MLALCITFLATAFFLGPELLSRWILGFVVPRRSLAQSRGEEITRALIWAFIPSILAILWAKQQHIPGRWGSWQDVRLVFSSLYSSNEFDRHESQFFASLPRVAGMFWSLLWRQYLLVIAGSVLLNVMIKNYRRIRSMVRSQWFKNGLALFVLPRVSEWHVILSDMLLPSRDVALEVDVLTRNGTLYQGRVRDRMLGPDGGLQTLTLTEPRRFLRDEFHQAQQGGSPVDREDYWRVIPSQLFVMMASDITSVNIRYRDERKPSPPLSVAPEDLKAIRDLLQRLQSGAGTPPHEPTDAENLR